MPKQVRAKAADAAHAGDRVTRHGVDGGGDGRLLNRANAVRSDGFDVELFEPDVHVAGDQSAAVPAPP